MRSARRRRPDPRLTAALGAATIAFSSILVKASHASPSTAAIFRCADAVPILAILAVRERRRHGPRPRRDTLFAAGAGVFFAFDLVLWAHSIDDVGAGLATVLGNVQVLLVPLLAWALLAEHPGRRVLPALPVTAAGVLLISGVLERGAYGRDPVAGTVYGVLTGIAYAGSLLLLRRGGVDLRRPAEPLLEMTLTAALVAALIGIVVGDARFVPVWPSAGWLALLALASQVLGWLLITTSLPRLPAAITSLLLMIQPVGSVLLAALIFGEAPSPLQLTGVAVLIGAVLFATGSFTPVSERDRARAGAGAPPLPGHPPA
jgi:drug/metabolite transporter (DMT)-like permease